MWISVRIVYIRMIVINKYFGGINNLLIFYGFNIIIVLDLETEEV